MQINYRLTKYNSYFFAGLVFNFRWFIPIPNYKVLFLLIILRTSIDENIWPVFVGERKTGTTLAGVYSFGFLAVLNSHFSTMAAWTYSCIP